MRRIVAGVGVALIFVANAAHADATSDAKKACGEAYENAQVLMKKDSLRQARMELDKCTAPVCAAFIREECTKWTSEVDAGISSIVPIFADSTGATVTPTALSVDGVSTPLPAAGAALEIDPGKHILEATRGSDHASLEITTERGKKNVATKIVFTTGTKAPIAEEPPPSTTHGGSIALPLAVGALGVAAVATSFVLGASAKSDLSDLDACKGHCAQKQVDPINTKITASTVFFIGGVVALGVSTVLFLTRSKKSTAAAPQTVLVF